MKEEKKAAAREVHAETSWHVRMPEYASYGKKRLSIYLWVAERHSYCKAECYG